MAALCFRLAGGRKTSSQNSLFCKFPYFFKVRHSPVTMSCFHPSTVKNHIDQSRGNEVLWIAALLETQKKPHVLAGVESQGENACVCSEHRALRVGAGDGEPSLLLHPRSGAASMALGSLSLLSQDIPSFSCPEPALQSHHCFPPR